MAKKIKKVETPIDQRETFVSIQKNFADSDLSVEEKLKTLYALQKADSAIDKILQLRGELPVEVENLETEIAEMKAKVSNINADIDSFNEAITEYKHNIVECDSAISKYKEQMNTVTNSREFDSLSKEVENQELLKKIAQKNVSDTKENIIAKKNDLLDLKDELAIRNIQERQQRHRKGRYQCYRSVRRRLLFCIYGSVAGNGRNKGLRQRAGIQVVFRRR